MGDLVQTLPALSDAAKAIPQIKFDWVVDEAFAQVPTWHSHVERVFATGLRRWGKNWSTALNSGELKSFVKQLRATQYDMIVDVQGGFKSAFLARLAKGPHAGHDQRGVHDWGAQFFYQKRFTVPKGMHSILRMRRLLAGALGYSFQEADLDYGIVRTRLARPMLDLPEPYLVFIHSTSWASKVWPEAYWKELVQQAVAKGFYVLLPWGDEAERQRSLRIAGRRHARNRTAATVNFRKGWNHKRRERNGRPGYRLESYCRRTRYSLCNNLWRHGSSTRWGNRAASGPCRFAV